MQSSSSSPEPAARTGRGGGWVVAQFAVMAAVLAAGFLSPDWPAEAQRALSLIGTVLVIAGGAFAVWAARTLGRSLTPFPKPVPAGLSTTGPFAVVRHPIYSGGLAFFVGYSLYASIPAAILTVVLGILWARKTLVEERWLVTVYDGYADYQAHVRRRLIPLVY